jgi:hypothetical protein
MYAFLIRCTVFFGVDAMNVGDWFRDWNKTIDAVVESRNMYKGYAVPKEWNE